MIVLRKLKLFAGPVPSSVELNKPLEDAKRDNAKFLQGLQRQSLSQKAPVTPMGDIRPAVVSAEKAPTFENGPKDIDVPTNEDDNAIFRNGDDEDFD